jgi:hypothetical protein
MNASLPVRDNYAVAKGFGGGSCGTTAGSKKNTSAVMMMEINKLTNDKLFWEDKMKLSSECSWASWGCPPFPAMKIARKLAGLRLSATKCMARLQMQKAIARIMQNCLAEPLSILYVLYAFSE